VWVLLPPGFHVTCFTVDDDGVVADALCQDDEGTFLGYWWSPSTLSRSCVCRVFLESWLVSLKRSSRGASWGLSVATFCWSRSLSLVANEARMLCRMLSIYLSCT
jgi:hypothetical protein